MRKNTTLKETFYEIKFDNLLQASKSIKITYKFRSFIQYKRIRPLSR